MPRPSWRWRRDATARPVITPLPWRWHLLPGILARTFRPRDETPVPVWAGKRVFLNRRITTKPGFYDVGEFPWTYEFQDMFRTRVEFDTGRPVRQIDWMKSSVAGVTEAALNGVRWMAENDPANVIFAIDNKVEAGNINEVRLQPTLRQLGENVFSSKADDASRYLLKLQRMLIYFLGSYSSGAFANKMAEVAIGDELEEHGKVSGDTSSVENLRSRIKSAERGLLVLMSKPKMEGGPIHREYQDGSQHVYEIPCPRCGVHQELLLPQLRFDHCKDSVGNWQKARVLAESYFECLHCRQPIREEEKRWFNERTRRRWRRTNFNASPGHISFHISDFYGYAAEASWGRIALSLIKGKGNPVARQGIRNHHEGLPYEIRATKTTIEDLLKLRGDYQRGHFPKKPWRILLGADVGLLYVKWVAAAFAADGEAWVVDWGTEAHPKQLLQIMRDRRYKCGEDGKEYSINGGWIDAKYRKVEVHKVCFSSQKRLWPIAGLAAELATRSISFNNIPEFPRWYKITVFIDRDAKHELYSERVRGWNDFRAQKAAEPPESPPLHLPADLRRDDEFAKELCNEHLVQIGDDAKEFKPDAAREWIWKRKGANHFGDAVKVCIVGYRSLTLKRGVAAPVTPGEAAADSSVAHFADDDGD